MNRKTWLLALLAVIGIASGPWVWQWTQQSASEITTAHEDRDRPRRYRGDTSDCGPPLTATHLATGTELARTYLQHAQRGDGLFQQELDWQLAEPTLRDEPTAQAMTTWALASTLAETHDPELAILVDRALAQWLTLTRTHDGRTLIQYPHTDRGQLSTIALVALALQDRLAAEPPPPDTEVLKVHLQGAIEAIQHASQFDHFAHFTQPESGRQYGPPTPTGDALATLVLIRQTNAEPHLIPLALASAETNWQSWVVQRRAVRERHPQLQQFAPWGLRLATAIHHAGLDSEGTWQARATELTEWFIDQEEIALSTYAQAHTLASMLVVLTLPELTPPFETKLRCVLRMTTRRNLALQAGHPLAMWNAKHVPATVPGARGGVLTQRQAFQTTTDATAHLLLAATSAGHLLLD